MDAQDRGRSIRYRGGIVVNPRPVRGADVAELGAAGSENLGDSESAADLDRLTPADQDLTSGGVRLERQEQGGGVVVEHQGALRSGGLPDHIVDVVGSRSAGAGR